MHLKTTLIAVLFITSFFNCYSQQSASRGKLVVQVLDEKGKGMPAVTASLMNVKDSSVAKFGITETTGAVIVEEIKQGKYFLKLTHTGFEAYFSQPFTIDENNLLVNLHEITLIHLTSQLKAVTVISQKPFIEKKLDKMIINVESSIISAGSSAMDVLERSPGVVIDRNDNISLKGKQGVIVMINGKPSGIAGSDLANYLRALPSGSIDKIEIITNPSAKYDAAGNAGIINIIMKKDQRLGTNGTTTISYGQGFYPKITGGLTLNHRQNKINLFGNYNYNYRDNYSNLDLYRKFYVDNNLVNVFDQSNFIEFLFKTHVYRAGLDYNISRNTIIGAVVNGIANRFISNGDTHTNVLDANEQKQSYNINNSITKDTLRHYAVNVNFKHSFDSTGKELTADLDYAKFNNRDNQHFVTDFFSLNGSMQMPVDILLGNVHGQLDIKSVKIDYVNPLKKGAKFEAGIKSSFVNADNDLKYYNASTGVAIYDPGQSNHFIYKENINAAYINFSKEFKKISLQVGVRAEQTNTKSNQLTTGQRSDTSYMKLFPSAFLNYNLSEKHSFGISVSRRIDRPNYNQLNPFRFYINNSTYREGNPYLLPQFTYSFELSHTYNQKITTTLSYSITRDNITEVIVPSTTQDKITIQTDRNLASFEYFGLSVSAPVQVTKWWNSVNNLNTYYGTYKGNIANTNLNKGNITLNINSSNSFIIGKKGWSAELSGFYQAKEVYGYMVVDPYWQVSAGVQKTIMKKKGVLKFNVADIFFTNNNTAVTAFRDYVENFHVSRDTRVFTLAFVYRFGNNKVAAARQRTGGAEEEKKRASGN